MATVTRWLASTALAAGLGLATLAAPAPAQAQSSDDLVRVIVDIADVIYHDGYPYYRYGDYGYRDRLVVARDYYGRRVYYRYAPRDYDYRAGPPYGRAHGYWKKHASPARVSCDRYGRCVRYYDQRRDGRYYDNRYYSYDRDRHDRDRYDRDRRWDDRRWRDRDDD